MYKARAKAWNLRKNITKAERPSLIRKVRQPRRTDQVLYGGRPVLHRLLRYCKEKNLSLGDLEKVTSSNQQQRSGSPLDANDRVESGGLALQSLFRCPSQPSRPIALYGDMTTAEVIIWNTNYYLNFYFTEGHGTRYFQPKPTVARCKGPPAKSPVLVRNQEAWGDLVEPTNIIEHIFDALANSKAGFIDLAFEAMNKAYGLTRILLKQQAPNLLPYFIEILVNRRIATSNLARNIRHFILNMAATVLGAEHPLSIIVRLFCLLPSTVAHMFVWRAVTDAFSKPLSVLEDSKLLRNTRWTYYFGLRKRGSVEEAQDYLSVLFGTDRNAKEQDLEFLIQEGRLLEMRYKYMEAETQYRKCLQLLKKEEREILADGPDSSSIKWRAMVYGCLRGLAGILESTERIDEAKAAWWREFDFVCAAWGHNSTHAQVMGAHLDDFLNGHGYIEESTALRARFPCLLRRTLLPPESLWVS